MNMPGIEWTPSDAASVNEFLSTALGKKWLGILMVRKPVISMASTETAALTGAYAAGYEKFFSEIAMTRVTMVPANVDIKPIDVVRD